MRESNINQKLSRDWQAFLCVAVLAFAAIGVAGAAVADPVTKPAAAPQEEGTRVDAPPSKPEPASQTAKPEGTVTYCPVSYFEKKQAVKGLSEHSLRYLGSTYWFATSAYRDKFKSDPEKYLPQYGAWCAMALGGPYNNYRPSDPTVFKIVESKLYLFSSERAKSAFETQIGGVIEKADRVFSIPYIKGYCPVSFQTKGRPIKGDHRIRAVYRRRPYQFVSKKEKALFVADPQRYLPRYDAYDPTSLAANRETSGELIIFSVYRDRTYFFRNERAKQVFDASPGSVIERADAFWETLRTLRTNREK